ncbi:TPA: hypothetical protein ACF35A_004625 [Escherichia coli]
MNDTMPVTNISGQNLLLNIHNFDLRVLFHGHFRKQMGAQNIPHPGCYPGSEPRGKHPGNFLPEYLR